MVWICGVDGFKAQWLAVLRNLETDEFLIHTAPFQGILDLPQSPAVVAVDLPIGLPEVTFPGGRTCETLARRIVGPRPARSVFSTVGRIALEAKSRAEADRVHRSGGGSA